MFCMEIHAIKPDILIKKKVQVLLIRYCKVGLLNLAVGTVKPVNKGHPRERQNTVFFRQVVFIWRLLYYILSKNGD